jgi:hypothetical protein
MRLLALIVSALVLGSCATAPQGPEKGSLQFVDLTDDFARVYDRDSNLPDAERVARLKAEFAALLPGLYDEKRVKAPAAKYDAYLLKGIKRFPQQRAGIERVSRDFHSLIGPAMRSFEAEFGPLTGYPPVYLVNSLNEFDGGTRELPQGVRLLFGADLIDQLYRDKPIQPFFQHELFHLMHSRRFTECDQIWCSLWMEGLAVLASKRLNPGASDAALLLDLPVPLRAAVESNRKEALCAVAARLHSASPDDYRPLFNLGGDGLSSRLPPRFAYYVGLSLAEEATRKHSLKSLAAMDNATAQPIVEVLMSRLAGKC